MTLESSLYSHLSGYSGLTALVSARIYPNQAPQNCPLPYVVYHRISAVREQTITRAIGSTLVRMQFSAFSRRHTTNGTDYGANEVRAQVRAALLAYTTGGGVTVHDLLLVNDIDLYEDDTNLHHCLTEAEILAGGDV